MCQICIYFYSFNTRKKTAHHMMIHSVNSVSQLSSHVHMMWLYCTCEKYVWNNTAGAGVSRSREVQRDQVPVGELRVFGVCMELWEVQHLYRALEGMMERQSLPVCDLTYYIRGRVLSTWICVRMCEGFWGKMGLWWQGHSPYGSKISLFCPLGRITDMNHRNQRPGLSYRQQI